MSLVYVSELDVAYKVREMKMNRVGCSMEISRFGRVDFIFRLAVLALLKFIFIGLKRD